MAYKIERSIIIAASPEAVWRIIQDPNRRTEWDARVIACRQTSDGEVQLGTSFEMVYNLTSHFQRSFKRISGRHLALYT
jgi:uncharacterized protein YndB with AHSA1/START domain